MVELYPKRVKYIFHQLMLFGIGAKSGYIFRNFPSSFLVIPCNDKESSSVEGNVFLFAAVGTILVYVDSELNGYIGDMS